MWPDSYSVFLALKMQCVGCMLQKFCTLHYVAETYQVPLTELIGELEKYITKRSY